MVKDKIVKSVLLFHI